MKFSIKAAPMLGLATLAALGLGAAPATWAGTTGLKVNAGDNVTVDGTGTTYSAGGGTNSSTTSYSGTSFGVLVASSITSTVFTLGFGGYVYGGAYGGNDRGSFSADVLNINGGTIAGGTYGISVANGAIANITSGTVQGSTYAIEVGTGSVLNISGGSFKPPSPDGGLDNYGVTDFFGSGFEYSTDGGTTFTSLSSSDTLNNSKGILEGTLSNGQPLYMNYANATGNLPDEPSVTGSIEFNVGATPMVLDTLAPEPASWAAFVFMGIGAASLIFTAKKRKALQS